MTATLDVKVTEIGALKARVLTFPRALYDARLAAAQADQRAKECAAEVKDAEGEALFEASMATESDGVKKKYTNDEQRKAAARKALTESATHRDLTKRLAEAEADALNARLVVAKLEDEHRAYRAVVDLTISEVTLLTAGR